MVYRSMNTLSLDRKLSIGDPPNVSEIDHEEDSSHNGSCRIILFFI